MNVVPLLNDSAAENEELKLEDKHAAVGQSAWRVSSDLHLFPFGVTYVVSDRLQIDPPDRIQET